MECIVINGSVQGRVQFSSVVGRRNACAERSRQEFVCLEARIECECDSECIEDVRNGCVKCVLLWVELGIEEEKEKRGGRRREQKKVTRTAVGDGREGWSELKERRNE